MPKKKYLVSLAKPDRRVKGMNIGGKFHKFGSSGHSFVMSDGGAAKEMNTEFGRANKGNIIVSEIPGAGRENGHRYSFTVKSLREEETLDERHQRMIEDGWVEFKPGQWKKVPQNLDDIGTLD